MTEFFPGSRQPLTGPPASKDLLEGREGKKFTIGGKELELFTISDLAHFLNRTPGAIRKWETQGIIPKATYVKPGANGDSRGKRRLYSRQQIEALVTLADEEKILYDLHRQISKTQFAKRALAAFKEIAR